MSPIQGFDDYMEYDDGVLKSSVNYLAARHAEVIWNQRISDILGFLNLQEGWDGEGAPAINPEVVKTALSFLNNAKTSTSMSPPNRVTTTQDGEIIMEWQSQNGDIFEVCIPTPNLVEIMEESNGVMKQYEYELQTQANSRAQQYSKPTSLWTSPMYQNYQAA